MCCSIGIIGGTSLQESLFFREWERAEAKSPYGIASVLIYSGFAFLQRHGSPQVPPHRIDHRANIAGLQSLGVKRIISINSVGSLKTTIRPGTFVIPDDFISIWNIPTFYDTEARYVVPKMHDGLRESILPLCKQSGMKVKSGGTYIQTQGPRLETKAEISMLKCFGDVVGMTMASEATLCIEADVPYVSLCSVDNYCNGITKTPLTMDKLEKNVAKNMSAIERFIHILVEGGLS